MANFRANHQTQSAKSGISRMLKYIVMLAVIAFVIKSGYDKLSDPTMTTEHEIVDEYDRFERSDRVVSDFEGEFYDNGFFSFLYDENHEQSRWVAYTLTRQQLKSKRLPRLKNFDVDRDIKEGSAHTKDYIRSGYTRGHLVPSADMSYSKPSLAEAYQMSNISPQLAKFNGGIWRELEEQTRDWASRFKALYIVTGPIIDDAAPRIGRNQVTVPTAFYKVLMDIDDPERKAIGFVIPHDVSYQHLRKYAVTVDEVERLTGIDFYSDLTSEGEVDDLESSIDIDLWPFDERRFELRKNNWNKK